MSKSTPISSLPNLKASNKPAFEEHENELVKEILNEIDNKPQPQPQQQKPQHQQQYQQPQQQQQQQQQQQPQQQPQPQQHQQPQQPQQPHQPQQQQMMEQQMMEQQMMEQQMMEQQQQELLNTNIPNLSLDKQLSLQEKILAQAKKPLLVGAIIAILSLPVVDTLINKIASTKEVLVRFLLPLTLLIKAVLGGGLFFGISNTIDV